MLKRFYFFIFLLSVHFAFSQNSSDKISISFEDATLKEIVQLIEEKSSYKFYYIDTWFNENRLSGSYVDTDIIDILEAIFEDTIINFFILKQKKVVLSPNTVIYDTLPDSFFGDTTSVKNVSRELISPIFQKNTLGNKNQKIPVVKIGKQQKNSTKRAFRLEGFVYNEETGFPISRLNINLKNSEIGTQTNKDGFYSIELLPGSYILEVQSMLYEEEQKKVIMYNDGKLNFNLREKIEELDEVVLNANYENSINQVTSGKEKIDIEASKNIPVVLGERDLLKVATTLPGITTAGEGAQGFNVRGGKSDQNLILLDDAVIYNPQHFFGIFSGLNPFSIKEVTIYKGSLPVEYGGRLSAVFDIKTKSGNKEKIKAEASIGPVTGNVEIELPVFKKKSSLMLGGRGAYANWILRSLDEPMLRKSKASFFDLVSSYDHIINTKNKIKATGYYSSDAFSITSDSTFSYNNKLLSLKWEHRFNEKNKGSLIASHSAYDFSIDFDGASNDDFVLENRISETSVQLKMNTRLKEKTMFNYGFSGKYYELQPGKKAPLNEDPNFSVVKIPEERALEAAAFLSSKFELGAFLFDLGMRYSFFALLGEAKESVFETGRPRDETTLIEVQEFGKNEVVTTYANPELRFSTRYLLAPDLSIKASYNNSYQYIHTLSTNTTASPIDTRKLSNINIKPQSSTLFSLGVNKSFKENRYQVSLEGFYKRLQNIVDFKTGSQVLLNENIETSLLQGKGKAYGIEFLMRKDQGRLNGWLSYTYSKTLISLDSPFEEERVNQGRFFPANFDKPHNINFVGNFKFTKRYSMSANFVYQTGRPITFPVGQFEFNGAQFPVFSDRNKFRVPDFYRLDIGFNIEGNHKIKKLAHSFFTISVYNVLGRNNPYSVFFTSEDRRVRAFKNSIFSVPVPSITYNLKF